MFPPLVKGPPVGRILKELVKLVLYAEMRSRLDALQEQPIGFIARAVGARNAELKAEGKEWGDAEVQNFIDVHLPAALDAAEEHAQQRMEAR